MSVWMRSLTAHSNFYPAFSFAWLARWQNTLARTQKIIWGLSCIGYREFIKHFVRCMRLWQIRSRTSFRTYDYEDRQSRSPMKARVNNDLRVAAWQTICIHSHFHFKYQWEYCLNGRGGKHIAWCPEIWDRYRAIMIFTENTEQGAKEKSANVIIIFCSHNIFHVTLLRMALIYHSQFSEGLACRCVGCLLNKFIALFCHTTINVIFLLDKTFAVLLNYAILFLLNRAPFGNASWWCWWQWSPIVSIQVPTASRLCVVSSEATCRKWSTNRTTLME